MYSNIIYIYRYEDITIFSHSSRSWFILGSNQNLSEISDFEAVLLTQYLKSVEYFLFK